MSESDEDIRNKALREASQYRNSGMDAGSIYAKPEKQGIPPHLAREVAYIVVSDRQQRHTRAQNEFNYLQVFLRLGLGVGTAVLSFFCWTGR